MNPSNSMNEMWDFSQVTQILSFPTRSARDLQAQSPSSYRGEDETLRGDVPCTRPKSLPVVEPAPDPLAQDSQSTLFPANQNISSQISTPIYLGSGIETGSHHRWAMEGGTVGKSLKKFSLLTSSASNTGQHHQM